MVVDLICGVGSQVLARIELIFLLGAFFSFVGAFIAYSFKWIKKFGIKQNFLTEIFFILTYRVKFATLSKKRATL